MTVSRHPHLWAMIPTGPIDSGYPSSSPIAPHSHARDRLFGSSLMPVILSSAERMPRPRRGRLVSLFVSTRVAQVNLGRPELAWLFAKQTEHKPFAAGRTPSE